MVSQFVKRKNIRGKILFSADGCGNLMWTDHFKLQTEQPQCFIVLSRTPDPCQTSNGIKTLLRSDRWCDSDGTKQIIASMESCGWTEDRVFLGTRLGKIKFLIWSSSYMQISCRFILVFKWVSRNLKKISRPRLCNLIFYVASSYFP
jgi:hypothetical protein